MARIEKAFANPYQESAWEAFKLTGNPDIMRDFIKADRDRAMAKEGLSKE